MRKFDSFWVIKVCVGKFSYQMPKYSPKIYFNSWKDEWDINAFTQIHYMIQIGKYYRL